MLAITDRNRPIQSVTSVEIDLRHLGSPDRLAMFDAFRLGKCRKR